MNSQGQLRQSVEASIIPHLLQLSLTSNCLLRWGQPIIVDSGYRCPKLNKAVKGAANSQHLLGQAADILTLKDIPAENKKLFDLIQRLKLPYDQLIDEYGYNWIHVSYGPRHRRRVLHLD